MRRREVRRADPLPEDESAWAKDTAPDPAEVAATAEQAERIASALAELPRPQLEAVSLAYFDELSHAEIAEAPRPPAGHRQGENPARDSSGCESSRRPTL